MANGKKSFVLYTDSQGLVNQLPDEIAGRLLKHIYSYVNDEDPETDDLILNIAFEPIKMQLKRDLKKYEKYIEKQKENGLKGGRPTKEETQKTQALFSKPKKADSVNVNDNDIINKETATPFMFFNSLKSLGASDQLANDWLKVRKTKKATNTETAFKKFISQVEKSGQSLNDVLEKCIEKSWSGFEADWFSKAKVSDHYFPQMTN